MTEEMLFKQVRKTQASSGSAKIGVALSGGMDSIVLAETLHRLEIPFLALHVDHGWRGKESRKEALWVKQWCRARGLALVQTKIKNTLPRTEAAAREARLAFFQDVAEREKLQEIWLAHHADDLVETFLLQLLRGAGPEGLASMPERRDFQGIVLVRPLLEFHKKELKGLAQKWKLAWCEDSSNQGDDYLRNRVRRGLLPYMKKISGRDPVQILSRLVRILADENLYWERYLPKKAARTLSVVDLKKQPAAVQRRVIRAWLISSGMGGLSFDQVEQVRGLLLQPKPAKVSQGRFCRRRQGILFLE
jgi:tRNA(Ile)-lysidine synthase